MEKRATHCQQERPLFRGAADKRFSNLLDTMTFFGGVIPGSAMLDVDGRAEFKATTNIGVTAIRNPGR